MTQWSDAITDSFVKLPLPAGSVKCMARVIDFYGASTPMMYDEVTVTRAATRRRSLLNSAMAFLAKANAKMDNALGTFRPDKVKREALLYSQPAGPSPPHRLDLLVDRPCAMGVLNSLFHEA